MKKSVFLTLIFIPLIAFAQVNPKTKWGKVTQEEINYSEVAFEPEAGAVILFEEGKTIIYRAFETEVYRRIKVLNERGLDAANQELTFYSHEGRENISSIRAQTINTENGQTKIIEVPKKEFYETQKNELYSSMKFTFPDVKVGSILEFKYTLTNNNLYLIDAWTFQHEYPTIYSEYSLDNRMNLDYTSLVIGEEIVKFAKKKSNQNLSNWTLINLPSINTIEFLYNPADAAERIVFQLRGYDYSTGSGHYGSSGHKTVMLTWPEFNKERSNYYNQYISKSVGRNIAQNIPNGENERETLKNVYDYFKKNYSWNKFIGTPAKKNNREVEKSKSGSATELNLLLYSALLAKDFNTELVLISTRSNGKVLPSYPYLGQFNKLINLVELSDESNILVDASDLNLDLGYAPLTDYNMYGMIVDPKNSSFIYMEPPISEFQSLQNYVFRENKFRVIRTDKKNGYFKTEPNELPKGLVENDLITYSVDLQSNEIKKDEADSAEDNFKMIRTQLETIDMSNISFMEVRNPLKAILPHYNFKQSTRDRAIEFNFPFWYKMDVNIDIPDGYTAEVPAGYSAHNKADKENLIYYQSAEVKNDKLLLHVEFYLAKPYLTDNYKEIKSFFEKSNTDAAKIILLKKK